MPASPQESRMSGKSATRASRDIGKGAARQELECAGFDLGDLVGFPRFMRILLSTRAISYRGLTPSAPLTIGFDGELVNGRRMTQNWKKSDGLIG